LKRRDFLTRAGSVLAAAGFWPAGARSAAHSFAQPENAKGNKYGVQLYSVRALMQRDPAGTIAALARAGFEEVEFAGFYGRTAREMRRLIDANALKSPAGHVTIDDLRTNLSGQLSDAATLGWRWLIVAWIDPKERTSAAYHSLARDFNRLGKIAARSGVRLGYHAEDYDFHPLANGSVPYDVMLRETDPALVDFEMDIYWVVKGGGDPIRYLTANRGRFPLLHIKDIDSSGKMVNAGEGVIDFPTIIRAWKQSAPRHLIIENDEPAHPIADVAAGLKYIRGVAH
jgi:sugar phosphate isomerase/epimerase